MFLLHLGTGIYSFLKKPPPVLNHSIKTHSNSILQRPKNTTPQKNLSWDKNEEKKPPRVHSSKKNTSTNHKEIQSKNNPSTEKKRKTKTKPKKELFNHLEDTCSFKPLYLLTLKTVF